MFFLFLRCELVQVSGRTCVNCAIKPFRIRRAYEITVPCIQNCDHSFVHSVVKVKRFSLWNDRIEFNPLIHFPDVAFSFHGNLKVHLLSHSGEKVK